MSLVLSVANPKNIPVSIPIWGWSLWLALAATSCVKIGPSQTAPERHYYVLDVARPPAEQKSDTYAVETGSANESAQGARGRPTLEVRRFSISPLYAGREFVYRGPNLASQTDYYNLFQIDPASLVTEETRRWLADCGLFSRVQEPGGYLAADRVLEGQVSALYADYGDPKRPQAVLELEFTLSDDSKTADSILLSRRYTQSIPLAEPSPVALVAGWNEALRQILGQFEDDLRNLSSAP